MHTSDLPTAGGGRAAKVLVILAIDVVMAVIGVWLLTRDRPTKDSVDAGVAVQTFDGGVVGPSPEPTPEPNPVPRAGPDASVPVPDPGHPRPLPTPGKDAGTVSVPTPPDAAASTPPPPPPPAPDAAPPGPPPAPDAAVDEPDRAESLRAQISEHLQSSQTRLSRCYSDATKALPEDQALTGEVDISFEVMPTGGTQNVGVVRNTTDSNQLASCLSAVVGSWTFEPFTGDPITFQRTFRFAPSATK